MTVELLPLRQALKSAGADIEGMTAESPLYHALYRAVERHPRRFSLAARTTVSGQYRVDPAAVSQWLESYRPAGDVGPREMMVTIGTAERKTRLKHISKREGAKSISELIRWIADSARVISRPEGHRD
jgi:hypothetical protein